MKYLEKAPFSGRASTPEFLKNYDKIDWSDRGEDWSKTMAQGKTRTLVRPEGILFWECPAHRKTICAVCAWDDGPVEVKQAGVLRG